MTARSIRLPDRFYLPRVDAEGREVRDVMPWEGALSYATDGERLGIQYPDGSVVWLGRGPAGASAQDDGLADGEGAAATAEAARTFADDFAGVNLDALVDGIRSYIDLHPVLKTVWRADVETLEALRHRAQGDGDGGS
ncbi:MAG TPA: hypothetical protein VM890_04390 [Longimicrobium sp.]|jgi:hypothetical protein|nr:hypothetical protein [Longimicrobium sp.]